METLITMHKSLVLLHELVRRRTGKTLSPAQLAKALNVSEQVVTNWAKRGVSMEGALKAQLAFGVDANFLLGLVDHPMLVPNQPPLRPAPPYTPAAAAAENPPPDYLPKSAWPFQNVSPDDWKNIPDKVRQAFEEAMLAIAHHSP